MTQSAAAYPINLVLLGPPGAGKSTIAAPLIAECNLQLLATGDRLRAEVDAGGELGRSIADLLERGQLVPDALMDRLMRSALEQLDPRRGCLIDGYPRTLRQALSFELMLADYNRTLTAVIALELDDDVAVRRLSGRRICSGAGSPFPVHIDDPASLERCRERGGHLVQRDDDKPEVVRERLQVYHEQTAPLIDYYRSQSLLHPIDADGTPDEVVARVIAEVRRITRTRSGGAP